MAEYQRRLAAVPARESELIELTRDNENLMNLYTTLSAKKENARMAVNMEQGQVGEQFRILEGARVPERPFSPNRPQIYSMGVFGGLMLGLALVALVEYRDTSLRTEVDVVSALALPVLALVPAMTTAVERHRSKRRRRLMSVAAATTMVVAVAAAAAWILFR
jgi:capsular polysaccharide biosynthesis protein